MAWPLPHLPASTTAQDPLALGPAQPLPLSGCQPLCGAMAQCWNLLLDRGGVGFLTLAVRAATQLTNAGANAIDIDLVNDKDVQEIHRSFCPNIIYNTTNVKANDDAWIVFLLGFFFGIIVGIIALACCRRAQSWESIDTNTSEQNHDFQEHDSVGIQAPCSYLKGKAGFTYLHHVGEITRGDLVITLRASQGQ